jgi:hypothetical protein
MRDFQVGNTIFHEGQILTNEDVLAKYNRLPLGEYADWIMPVELYFQQKGAEIIATGDVFFATATIVEPDDLQKLKKVIKSLKKVFKKKDIKKLEILSNQFKEIVNKYITVDNQEAQNG